MHSSSVYTPPTGNFQILHSPQFWIQDVVDALRPLDATSWAEVPLALQLHTLQGRTVLLRLTLKRRKLPHPSFDPKSDLPIFPRATGPEANHCNWSNCNFRTNVGWYGT